MALVLAAFGVGYYVSPKRKVLAELRRLEPLVEEMKVQLGAIGQQHYAAGFSNCAKYVAQTHGHVMSEEQLNDVLNEVKRVCNVSGVKI